MFQAKIVFKEQMLMYILASVLELMRDVMLTQLEELETKYPESRDYLNKIIVDKRFQARFVANSGT